MNIPGTYYNNIETNVILYEDVYKKGEIIMVEGQYDSPEYLMLPHLYFEVLGTFKLEQNLWSLRMKEYINIPLAIEHFNWLRKYNLV